MHSHLFKPHDMDRYKMLKVIVSSLISVGPYFDFESIKRMTSLEATQRFNNYYLASELWRLFVDGIRYSTAMPEKNSLFVNNNLQKDIAQQYGITDCSYLDLPSRENAWLGYESRENGALANCFYALRYALFCLESGRQFNTEIIKGIHYRLTNNLAKDYDSGEFKSFIIANVGLGRFRNDPTGLLELFDKIAKDLLPHAYIEIPSRLIRKSVKNELSDVVDTIIYFLKSGNDSELISILGRNQSEEKCYLTKANLNKIKTIFPAHYEEFLKAICQYIASHREKGAIYFSVGTMCTIRTRFIDTDLWSRLPVEDKFRKIVDRIEPEMSNIFTPEYQRDVQTVLNAIPKNISEEITIYLNKLLFQGELNVKLDDKVVDALYKYLDARIGKEWLINRFDQCTIDSPVEHEGLKNDAGFIDAWRKRVLSLKVKEILNSFGFQAIKNFISDRQVEALEQYYNDSEKIKNLTNKAVIQNIGNLIKQLQCIHGFGDGVGRLYVNVILNCLLMENGFPPATFAQPNIFDAFNDIPSAIARGILNTLEIYENAEQGKVVNLFGVKSKDVEDVLKKQIEEIECKLLDNPIDEERKTELKNLKSLLMTSILTKADDLCKSDSEMNGLVVFDSRARMRRS